MKVERGYLSIYPLIFLGLLLLALGSAPGFASSSAFGFAFGFASGFCLWLCGSNYDWGADHEEIIWRSNLFYVETLYRSICLVQIVLIDDYYIYTIPSTEPVVQGLYGILKIGNTIIHSNEIAKLNKHRLKMDDTFNWDGMTKEYIFWFGSQQGCTWNDGQRGRQHCLGAWQTLFHVTHSVKSPSFNRIDLPIFRDEDRQTILALLPHLRELLNMPKDMFATLRQLPHIFPLPVKSMFVDESCRAPYDHNEVVKSENDEAKALVRIMNLTDSTFGDIVQKPWMTIPDFILYHSSKQPDVMADCIGKTCRRSGWKDVCKRDATWHPNIVD